MWQHVRFYVTMIVIILVSTGLAIWVYDIREGKDILSFTVSIVSFAIALLALFVAIRTYLSIDSVDNMGKMDGNILDNENYVTSAAELILEFQEGEEEDLGKKIFKSIEDKLKKESSTAVQFADTLQYMIDLIIFFPAVYNAKNTDREKYDNKMQAILKRAEEKHEVIKFISKGNSIQIKETIKLFKGVISYQKYVANNNFNVNADLLHVRGPILRNPVTKTIYHNYIGLYYNKKGMQLIRDELGTGKDDLLSIPLFKKAYENITKISAATREDIILYLESACEQFDKALLACGEDIAWPGFINYNKARTLYFLSLFNNNSNSVSWDKVMNSAISARSKVNRLIDEVLESKNTHLKEFFIHQEELARLVNLNLTYVDPNSKNPDPVLIYQGSDLKGKTRNEVEKLFKDLPSFSIIKKYQDELLDELFKNSENKEVI